MRISTSYQYEVYNSDITSAQNTLFQAQQQETTGLAINLPSDNPVGAQQVASMHTIQNSLNQYQSNLSTAKGVLTVTDSALQTAVTAMQSAQSIAVQGASSATMDDSTRQNLVAQITQLQQSLVSTGNTQGPEGQYVFAGQKTDTQPFSVDSSGNLQFAGDNNNVTVLAGPSDNLTVNVPGGQLFSDAYNALQSLKNNLSSSNGAAISNTDLAAISSATTALSTANGNVGATAVQVATLSSYNTRRISDLTSQVANIQNINTAEAATNYASASNAYQAALTVVGKASSLSLMNYISGSL